MTIWLNAHRSPAMAVWISATFSDIHQRSDRRYFSIILGIVAQLRYNYKIYRSTVNNLQKLKVSCMGCFDKSSRCN